MPDGAFPEPPTDEEIEERLATNKRRLDEARRKHEAAQPKGPLDQETARGMGVGLSAAYAIIGLPLVGAGIGWAIDRALGTVLFIPILAVAGLIGGMVHAVQLSNRT